VRRGRREDGMKGRGNKGFLPLKGEGKEMGSKRGRRKEGEEGAMGRRMLLQGLGGRRS